METAARSYPDTGDCKSLVSHVNNETFQTFRAVEGGS